MDNFKKRVLSLLLAFVLAIPVLTVPVQSEAAPKVTIDKKFVIYGTSPEQLQRNIYTTRVNDSYKYKNNKYTNIKSSNTNVVTAKNSKYQAITLSPKDFGKSTITFKFNGKKLSQEVEVKKWSNPLKSLKIGNTEYKKYFNDYTTYNFYGKKNRSGVIKVVPKSGWKVVSIRNNTAKKLKNNSKVSLDPTRGYTGSVVLVHLKNTKTKEEEIVTLGCINQNAPDSGMLNSYDYLKKGYSFLLK